MANIIQHVGATSRVNRRPQHAFQLRHRPWQVQPAVLAPVLPGETLKSALIQARVVTDPVKNPLVGWWYEMYLFYVRFRDMPDSQHFQNMMLQLGYDLTSVNTAAKVTHYHGGGTVDWADQCLRAVLPHYFRDDGEAWNIASIGAQPAAKINNQTWLDSVLLDSQNPQGATIAGGSTSQAATIALEQFQMLRDMKLTSLTYEEYLRTHGVQAAMAQPQNKPELIRYVRDYNYPSNTVNPVDGSAASALSWSIAERADKDRYFSEPGFIFGCVVARPKVYVSKQVSAAAGMLNDVLAWLPVVMADNPDTSLKKFAQTAGPLAGLAAEPYWVDVRDLFLYGDQFVNFALTETDAGLVALPTAAMQKKYASATDADALFKTSTANLVKCDGVASFTIAGHQVDHT